MRSRWTRRRIAAGAASATGRSPTASIPARRKRSTSVHGHEPSATAGGAWSRTGWNAQWVAGALGRASAARGPGRRAAPACDERRRETVAPHEPGCESSERRNVHGSPSGIGPGSPGCGHQWVERPTAAKVPPAGAERGVPWGRGRRYPAAFFRRVRMPASQAPVTIAWFRHDLRLDDNPALAAAADRGAVVPVYVLGSGRGAALGAGGRVAVVAPPVAGKTRRRVREGGHAARDPHAARRSTRCESGREGDAVRTRVVWNRRYEPAVIERDTGIKKALAADGLEVESFNGSLLYRADARGHEGGKAVSGVHALLADAARARGAGGAGGGRRARSGRREAAEEPWIEDLGLLPTIDWAAHDAEDLVAGRGGGGQAAGAVCGAAAWPIPTASATAPTAIGTSCPFAAPPLRRISPRRVVACGS